MITRERLEELIKEGATIYSKSGHPYVLKDNYVIKDNTLYQIIEKHRMISTCPVDKLDELYETQKQAEWALKYHATRTEELDLPTWEEFKDYNENISVSFVGEDWCVYELSIEHDEIVLCQDEAIWLRWDLTEKDYIKACDLCLKLFEGEE